MSSESDSQEAKKPKSGTKPFSGKKLFYIISLSIISVLLMGLIIMQVMTQMGYFPNTDVLYSGKEVHPRQLNQLKDAGIITESDEVTKVFSGGYFSIVEDGNLFTPDKFVTWQKNEENKVEVFEVPFEEVTDIRLNIDDSQHTGFSMLVLHASTNRTFGIPIAKQGEADKKFYESLITAWQKKLGVIPDTNPVSPVPGSTNALPNSPISSSTNSLQ